jgi:hypothetical protein
VLTAELSERSTSRPTAGNAINARGADAGKIDHHAEAAENMNVEGILAFAELILPRASDLWVQASLDYKQRLQQLFARKAWRSSEIDSIDPPSRQHFSSTWRRLSVLMKEW